MRFDPLDYPYPSRRNCVFATRGMVATSQPLAAQAGLSILQQGGNAIDAAIATAAALTVVEPTSNGLGSDAFALIWTGGKLHGLNSSGPAPRSLSLDALKRAGLREMPRHGLTPAMVPGAPAAWVELNRRFGRLPLQQVLAPAAEYAERGYPISPTLGRNWQAAFESYRRNLTGEEFRGWFDTFAPGGRAPAVGEVWRSPGHARTLRLIGETAGEAFYRGELAERIAAFAARHGGYITQADLASFSPEWVEPLRVHYRGYDVWELPPNGQGLVALLALNILKGFTFGAREDVETYHLQIEAMKLAFADGLRFIADPRAMDVTARDLLSDAYAEERRRLIGRTALEPAPGRPPRGGTVYLAAADAEGNMVSYIQSNYMGFGCGVVIPDTGIALNNRGHTFSLDPAHPNCLEPGKRPYNTIIPGFLTRDGEAVGPFGVMGGFMQPQGHVQVITNTIDFGMNPQAALDAPRWRWVEGRSVEMEHSVRPHIVDALARRGHAVRWVLGSEGFGRGQIIWRMPDGVLVGATEPRTDGHVAAW